MKIYNKLEVVPMFKLELNVAPGNELNNSESCHLFLFY